MGDIWTIEKLSLFLLFFIPGFISVKIYQVFIPSEKIDFSKSIFEVIGYSCINLGLFSWLILFTFNRTFIALHPFVFYTIVFFLVFISPVALSYAVVKLSRSKLFNKYFINPLSAWDFVFLKKEGRWIFVTLKSGEKIIGRFGKKSYFTSNSIDKQLFIEEVWKIDDENKLKKVDRTEGILLFGTEIIKIEFKL